MTGPPLLIVWHSRTGASDAMARAAAAGAAEGGRLLGCEAAQAGDFLAARGYLFCGPENLATLSGAMKEMFDRLYYPLLGRIEGRAYASLIAAGSDGSGPSTSSTGSRRAGGYGGRQNRLSWTSAPRPRGHPGR